MSDLEKKQSDYNEFVKQAQPYLQAVMATMPSMEPEKSDAHDKIEKSSYWAGFQDFPRRLMSIQFNDPEAPLDAEHDDMDGTQTPGLNE